MKEQKYRPENPQYAISEEFAAFPRELTFAGDTRDEIFKTAMEQLIAEPTTAMVLRMLDETEIEEVRREYTTLLETEMPDEKQVLADLLGEEARIKEEVKAQREVLHSLSQHVDDCIQTIKGGTTAELLDAAQALRVAVDGHYLHYTYEDGRFFLAKVERIPEKDIDSLFVKQTRNREVFIEKFGYRVKPSEDIENSDGQAATEDTLQSDEVQIGQEDDAATA